jgi:hypothetical protein
VRDAANPSPLGRAADHLPARDSRAWRRRPREPPCTESWYGLVRAQPKQHRRKYRRWQREAPMHLWRLDLVGGVYLADGRECKMLTGIDDHSRFVVIATVLAVPSGRAVADAFLKAMRVYGVPSEALTDNGNNSPAGSPNPGRRRCCSSGSAVRRGSPPGSPAALADHNRQDRALASDPAPRAARSRRTVRGSAHGAGRPRCVGAHLQLRPATPILGHGDPASLFRPNAQPEPVVVAAQPDTAGNQDSVEALPTTETDGAVAG